MFKNVVFYDTEVYPNFFLVIFKGKTTGNWKEFSFSSGETPTFIEELRAFLKNKTLVGKNSVAFDDVLLKYLLLNTDPSVPETLANITTEKLWELASKIIELGSDWWRDEDLKEIRKSPIHWAKSVDTGIEFNKVSLKELEVRMQMLNVKDLPFAPGTILKPEDIPILVEYCRHDIEALIQLYETKDIQDALSIRLELEKLYGAPVLTLTGPKVAEKILTSEYFRLTGKRVNKLSENYERPDFYFGECVPELIQFEDPDLQKALGLWKTIRFSGTDKAGNKKRFRAEVRIKDVLLKLGVGGIHSQDSSGIFKSSEEATIIDADASSYYPAILLNYNIKPAFLNENFLNVYREIRDNRVLYKAKGEEKKANGLKLCLNATFGKFGAKGPLNDLKALYSVTITGQLGLMMLAERIAKADIPILSMNTDGITCFVPKSKKETYREICSDWEKLFQFSLEFVEYDHYFRRDVNNYFSIYRTIDKKTGESVEKIKKKGAFGDIDLSHKQDAVIVKQAVIKNLIEGIPLETTIQSEKNILNFCISFKSKIPIHLYNTNHPFDKEELQRVNRWYFSNSSYVLVKKDEEDHYKPVPNGQGSTRNNVVRRKSSGITLANALENTEIPKDLVREPYLKLAKKLLKAVLALPEKPIPQKLLHFTEDTMENPIALNPPTPLNSAPHELLVSHIENLEASGISEASRKKIKFKSLWREDLEEIYPEINGLDPDRKIISALAIPYRDGFVQYKLFPSIETMDGHTLRYFQPKGSGSHVFYPPEGEDILTSQLNDIETPLYFIEGAKKAIKGWQEGLKICLGLEGCSMWSENGQILEDIRKIPMVNRNVYWVVDSDWSTKPEVRHASFAFGRNIGALGGKFSIICLPQTYASGKTGLDDYLLKHSLEEFHVLPKIEIGSKAWRTMFKGERLKKAKAKEVIIPKEEFTKRGLISLTENENNPAYIVHLFLQEQPKIVYFEQNFYRYNGKCYEILDKDGMIALVHPFLKRLIICDKMGNSPYKISNANMNDILLNIRAECHVASRETPFFFSNGESDPKKVICLNNGLFDWESDLLLSHTDNFFNLNCLNFDYDPKATCPLWHQTLYRCLGGNRKAVTPEQANVFKQTASKNATLLQQWLGYSLTSEFRFQAFMLLVGLPGSGKSTILNTFQKLVGPKNYCSFSFASLGAEFGLEFMVGKNVAFAQDAHFSNSFGNNHVLVLQRLKSITGGDPVEINRKSKSYLSKTLPTKLTFSVNEIPRLNDKANALERRLLAVEFPEKIEKQNINRFLEEDLVAELPGIFNWAINGLYFLLESKGFIEMSDTLKEEFKLANNPIYEFLEEYYWIAPNIPKDSQYEDRFGTGVPSVACDEVYNLWKEWAETNGLKPGSKSGLSVALKSLDIQTKQLNKKGDRNRYYSNLLRK